MNVRLLAQTKAAGDAELARVGATPTEFVRAAWEKLARGGSECQEIEAAVLGSAASSSQGVPSKTEALRRARALYADHMARFGIDPQAPASGIEGVSADRDAYINALRARMAERGTL